MNHCASYEPMLDAFAEGDLFMEDMVWVQKHLNSCPDCQAYVDDLLAIRAAFPTVEDTQVPAGFAEGVMAAVAAAPQATAPQSADLRTAAKPAKKAASRKTPWIRGLSGLAACCAIVLLAQGGLRMAGGGASMAPKAEEAPAEMMYSTSDSVTETAAEEQAAPAEAMPEAEAAAPTAEAEAPMTDLKSIGDGSAAGTIAGETSPYRLSVTVDAAYIGDLLDGYTPVAERSGSSVDPVHTLEYALTTAEYEALLAQLADRNELPAEEDFESDSDLVQIIVRQ